MCERTISKNVNGGKDFIIIFHVPLLSESRASSETAGIPNQVLSESAHSVRLDAYFYHTVVGACRFLVVLCLGQMGYMVFQMLLISATR